MARKQGSHSDITGPRVLDTALRLIAEHGFAAVSMRQIASEVGVQAGALYNYTPDKQSLLFDMMRAHMAELLAALRAVDLRGDALCQLETFTRFHIRFHLPRPDQVFVSYMELRSLSPENFAVIERMRRDYEDALEAILRQGETEGVFAVANTRVATRAIIAMLTGLSHWYRDGGALDIAAIEAIYWDMVRKSVAL
ncbi:TetR/AcrR family transcriptional regulator [Cognatiyoonia sp. IB215446]|uniref:TetR/AcrR family transcriptional regulator n=1 Tax=Cognatiyoonia sp. IB215446 TaxID=3097355 RepID=UPI002A143636|nr:TetR/AcrR family transcriptional regulator [Cognatiyoonia sp. IB215446]MDX8347691.1 TetR/AcrR family transcriptional regulator [Cognatiyoonia sp. IB215446]